jgi:hypothetical protein
VEPRQAVMKWPQAEAPLWKRAIPKCLSEEFLNHMKHL